MILQARINGDPATTTRIDQTNGIITITQSDFDDRLRNKLVSMSLETTPTAFLNATKAETLNNFYPNHDGPSEGIIFDFTRYDNNDPVQIVARNKTDGQQKLYTILLQAAGPVQFVSVPGNSGVQSISLRHYVSYHVSLPVMNLYDGKPKDFRIVATAEGSSIPIELEIAPDLIMSRDLVTFYFKQKDTEPGIYTIELRKADGQRATAPVRIRVEK